MSGYDAGLEVRMTAYFLDSSALAKRFVRESGTGFIQTLLRPSAHHAIYTARLTEVEVCAALARRHKGLKITADQFQKSLKRLQRDFTERFAVIAITEGIVASALQMTERYALRGYDALQLSSALDANRRQGAGFHRVSGNSPRPAGIGRCRCCDVGVSTCGYARSGATRVVD